MGKTVGKAQRHGNGWGITDGGVSMFRKSGGWGEADKMRWRPGACWGSGRPWGLRRAVKMCWSGAPFRNFPSTDRALEAALALPHELTYWIYCTNNIITIRKIFRRQRIIYNHMPMPVFICLHSSKSYSYADMHLHTYKYGLNNSVIWFT